ncbi:MAG: hypothetical protein WB816_08505 [Methylocystis sp.]
MTRAALVKPETIVDLSSKVHRRQNGRSGRGAPKEGEPRAPAYREQQPLCPRRNFRRSRSRACSRCPRRRRKRLWPEIADEGIQDIVIAANLTPRKYLGFNPVPGHSLGKNLKAVSLAPVALHSRIHANSKELI